MIRDYDKHTKEEERIERSSGSCCEVINCPKIILATILSYLRNVKDYPRTILSYLGNIKYCHSIILGIDHMPQDRG